MKPVWKIYLETARRAGSSDGHLLRVDPALGLWSLPNINSRTPNNTEPYTINPICNLSPRPRQWRLEVHFLSDGVAMAKRILIVDDNELIRRQVRRILEPEPEFEICAEAENGAEAVQKARKYRPDLIVMDVFMPEMSGIAAVREIKKMDPQLPVAFLTLYDSGDLRFESEKAGADAVLQKTKAGVELLPTIRGLLCRH